MVTLAQLKAQARQRADMERSQFVSDAELTTYINNSIAELHDLLIAAYCEDYYMTEHQFTTSSITYALPADFYKLRGVDIKQGTGDQWSTVKRFNFNRRNEDSENYAWNLLGLPYIEYRLVGSNIRFSRIPDANSTLRMWYYPKAPVLANDSDQFDDLNQYAVYVVTDVAIKMLQKEESDVTVLAAQKAELKQRLQDMAQNRDANEPESVSDIYGESDDFYWSRGV